MVSSWVLSKLEPLAKSPKILVQDPLRILPEADGALHGFARDNGYTVIMAATNLVFRDLYEKASADRSIRKLLVIDRAPVRRQAAAPGTQAPAPLYPDLLDAVPPAARIRLDLQEFLKDRTGDPNWPAEVNTPKYSRLLLCYLPGVLRAHQNLRNADPGRFTDNDLKAIIAFAALDVADAAFKQPDAKLYWRIGLMGHEVLQDLDPVAPEITRMIREELSQAPAPFCWLSGQNITAVLKALYLAVILSQHFDYWDLLLVNLDPSLAGLNRIDAGILSKTAPELIEMDVDQAAHDLQAAENSLSVENLKLLLQKSIDVSKAENAAKLIEKEHYSNLFRSLALLMMIKDLLSGAPDMKAQEAVYNMLFAEPESAHPYFADRLACQAWNQLKRTYRLTTDILEIESGLTKFEKDLSVLSTGKLTFEQFWQAWNRDRLNRLEYYLSDLERLVTSADLLPRLDNELPTLFGNTLIDIRSKIRQHGEGILSRIDAVNKRFQQLVAARYPEWIRTDADVRLTAQFIDRCLKPHWDPHSQAAVLFIFDGMRYDIWEEMLRPMLETRMSLIAEYSGASILPSETHFTRKAISAGDFPDAFDSRAAEDKLLHKALEKSFGITDPVEVIDPDGGGVGETVHYRTGKLDVYIFELCDKELHKVAVKTTSDGKTIPTRPLAFIYRQHIKNILDTEVMAIVRSLAAGTKVFITADHGFTRVGRKPGWFEETDLNEPMDCRYLYAFLKIPFDRARVKPEFRKSVIAFTPAQLRMPASDTVIKKKAGKVISKTFESIVFPQTGFSFSRKGSPYNPDAFSHGGISLGEMMIPMAVLEVKPKEEGLITLDAISGPSEGVENETLEFRLKINRIGTPAMKAGDIRADVSAFLRKKDGQSALPDQVLYVPASGVDVMYRVKPETDDADPDELREGIMKRVLTVTVRYREGHRSVQKTATHAFTVQLNPEKLVRRVPTHLGKILGLTPKGLR